MKILHLCLANFYIDKYSYQENMLTKYHKELGFNVEIIASLVTFNENGESCLLKDASRYNNEHDITVTRLDYKKTRMSKILRKYKGTYKAICNANPDIIFIHGCQFLDMKDVVKYVKRNPQVKVFVDNHADLLNSAKSFLSKNILHKIIWKKCAQMIEPYTEKFYGVLPARVEFLTEIYKIPKKKVELLVMGADDEKVKEAQNKGNRKRLRNKLNINEEDFLIITGGKIDKNKLQILLLMKAIKNMKNVKLVIFGSVLPEYKEEFESLLSESVIYIGWIDANQIYHYLNSADLVVFPGLHSVLWEQAVGLGKPCVFKHINGFTHIDIGGNCKFLYKDSVGEIEKVVSQILHNDQLYKRMNDIALTKGMNTFSYKKIALKSISHL